MNKKTIRLEVTKHCHVFQPGCILELSAQLVDGELKGYSVPDKGDGSDGTIPVKSVKKRAGNGDQAEAYYGKCLLTQVSNFYKNNKESENVGLESIGPVKPEQVRVIHYPDCQQIVFHMPKYAYDAGSYQITDLVTGEAIVKCAVKDKLSGSTMMLLDSLPLKPGFYSMEADWPGGWTHQVRFIKFTEGFPNAAYANPPANVRQAIRNQEQHLLNLPIYDEPVKVDISKLNVQAPYKGYQHPPGNVSMIQNDKEYRLFDSNGVEMENGPDLKKFRKDLVSKFGPVVEYTQDGRGGRIFYKERDVNITFDWEFGGGNAVVIIYIPEERYWEAQTKTPLSRRREILGKMARQVIVDQAPGCDYEVYSNSISIVY